jgi:hypothetical protein
MAAVPHSFRVWHAKSGSRRKPPSPHAVGTKLPRIESRSSALFLDDRGEAPRRQSLRSDLAVNEIAKHGTIDHACAI